MVIDHALILAAGKGTRMGDIGKILPKVIWPVFEKSILELEVDYAKMLGAKETYINLYNHKDVLLNYINSHSKFNNVIKIIENEILDVGGAVHNLAKKLNYQGTLLVLNSDQFIMLSEIHITNALNKLKTHDMVLFTHDVTLEDGYNKLEISKDRLLNGITNHKIIKNIDNYETYTGMAIINLNQLDRTDGESKFFDSVANPFNKKIYCYNIKDASYWDFGTIKRYHDSMFNILDCLNSDDDFIKFLIKEHAIDLTKVKNKSYYSSNFMGINLSDNYISLNQDLILLENSKLTEIQGPAVIYKDVIVRP